MRIFLSVLALAAVMPLCAGNVYYVDSKLGNYAGHDGSSWEKAYETIQEAINRAAASGDRILVASGVYEGGKTFSSWGKARLSIINKSIWIEGAGAEKTIVRGRHGSSEYGLGTSTNDSCACVHFYGAPCKGTVLKGMTFCNGAPVETRTDPLGMAEGGSGLYQIQSTWCSGVYVQDCNREVYVVDCIVSNCLVATTAGVLRGLTAVRTKIVDNHLGGPAASPTLVGDVNLLHCLVAHNSTWKNGDGLTAGGKVVNCTFIDNYMTTQIGSTSTAWLYNSITYGRSTTVNVIAENMACNVIGAAEYQYPVMSLWTDDIRIRRNSGCAGLGEARYLADTSIIPELPAGIDRFVDLHGNAVPQTGTICPGAVQEVADEVAGRLQVDGDTSLNFFRIDGGSERYAISYHFPSNYPSQFAYSRSRCTASNHFMRVYVDPAGGRYENLYPDDRGEVMLTPPPTVGAVLKLGAVKMSDEVMWVDPAADSAVADGSEEKPYRTFKTAIESVRLGTARLVIYAKPGIYAEGDMTSNRADLPAYKFRVFGPSTLEVRIVGVEGPERTFLKGAPDPVTGGLGDNAVRVACGHHLHIVGCTLTGGYSDASNGANKDHGYCARSGGLMSPQTTCLLSHCIVSNNFAEKYAAVDWALMNRCLVVDNHALGPNAGGVLRACYLISSVVGANDVSDQNQSNGYIHSGGQNNMRLINTTILAGAGDVPWIAADIPRLNSVLVGGSTAYANGTSFNNFYWNVGTIAAGSRGYVRQDPMYIDQDGETRVFAKSPVLSGAAVCDDFSAWFFLSRDFYGNRWRFNADGTYAAGAFQDVVAGGVYVVGDSRGGLAVDGETGYFPLSGEKDVTVSLAAGATRPVAAYVKNGVTNAFESAGVTVTAAEAAGGGVVIEPAYSNEWFVDDDGSDTANFGYNASTPFKTLKKALENPQLIRGDVVKVLPGVYADGEMLQDAVHVIPSRAVVRNGITLEAVGTAAETIIRGRASDVQDTPSNANYQGMTEGLGKNAVRCVWTESGAVVRGLTLENGHTRGFKDDGSADHGDADYNGGNAYGEGRLEKCVLRNGKAFRGGGTIRSRCHDCTFCGNTSLYGGGATSDSYMYGCLSYGNTCLLAAERSGFFFYQACENSTIADADGGPASLSTTLRNCLITGSCMSWVSTGGNPGSTNFVNCAINADKTAKAYFSAIAAGTGCVLTNAANLALDADYRPIIGSCLAVDAGDASISPNIGATDLSGGQRIYNGRLDIGALEADWRAIYAHDIRPSNLVVDAATSNVVETAEGAVLLRGEAALAATWTQRPGRKRVTVRVTGCGTLLIRLNGEDVREVTSATAETPFEFISPLAVNRLDFIYRPGTDDAGGAEILDAKSVNAFVLSLR